VAPNYDPARREAITLRIAVIAIMTHLTMHAISYLRPDSHNLLSFPIKAIALRMVEHRHIVVPQILNELHRVTPPTQMSISPDTHIWLDELMRQELRQPGSHPDVLLLTVQRLLNPLTGSPRLGRGSHITNQDTLRFGGNRL